MFVALGTQYAMRMCHMWPVQLYNIFFPNYPIKSKIVEKNVTEHKVCFDFFYNFRLKYFSF